MEQLLTGTGVVRTPIFPYSFYQDILSGRLSVEELISIPAFMHGLFLASPDLHTACARLFDTDVEPGKVAKLKQAILKYAYRASTRSTPFGLFSGLSTFTVSPTTTEFKVNSPTKYRTHVRLDVDFVGQLADHLSRQPYIRPYLLYQCNSSLYTLGSSYRYFGQTYRNHVKKFELKSVQATPVLTNLFKLAATPTMLSALADSLVDEDVHHDEAVSFLYDLVEQQLLVSELAISGTGDELGWQLVTTLNKVVSRITNTKHQADFRATMGQLERLLQALSALNTIDQHSITAYNAIIQQASELIETLTSQFLFQCDTLLSFRTEPQLATTTVADIQRAIAVKAKLTGPPPPDATLQRFIKAFIERYDDNEVPLTEALDVDNGIGYGNHQGRMSDSGGFIDQLPFNKAVSETISFDWYKPLHHLLTNRILDAYVSKSSIIKLTDDELKTLPGGDLSNWNHNTYSCGFSLFEDEQKQPIIQLTGCGGHTAAALVGRFCHADPALDSLVRSITQYEETINADCLLAEVNHLPQDRLGNVMQRPVLRTYEIPILTNSIVDPAQQLPLSDLLVSVRQGRVILRSRKYNRRVLPYLTSALNHSRNGIPIFKFLGDVQLQENTLGLGINMGVLPRVFPYVPRLQYKNIILKRATWFLSVQQIKVLTLAAQKSHTAFNAEADTLGLPAYFVVADHDNEMPICRANNDSVSLFADMVKGRSELVLLEFLPAHYTTPVRSETGDWYMNECVLFFKNSSKVARPVVHHPTGETGQTAHKLSIKSSFVPGSEWVYVKLYTGLKVADQLIANLNAMLQPLQAGQIIRNWFFIRYSEGGNHIRLRLQMVQPDQISNVFAHLTPLFDQWKQQRLIWKVSLDTYEREWQRYGVATMEVSERLFGLDSQLVSTLVRRLPDLHRWLVGLCLTDLWMSTFGLTTAEKLAFANRMKEGFEREFEAGSEARKFLNATFGKHKQIITSLLSGQPNPSEQGVVLFIRQTLNIHHGQMLELMNQLRDCTPGEPLVGDLLSSFVHMSVNRLFRSRQRLFEYAIYHFLRVHYTTQHYAAEPIAQTVTPVSSVSN